MTIYEFICNKVAANCVPRLKSLRDINAPQIIIDNTIEIAKLAKERKLVITGDTEALDLTYESDETRTGNGGKKYSVFTTVEGKTVNYFPNARYGRFIKFA